MNSVLDFFRQLFGTGDWPQGWQNGVWTELEGWLYIISDSVIWGVCSMIAVIMARFAFRRGNRAFLSLCYTFAIFAVLCGVTHFSGALMFWVPAYRVDTLLRAIAALAGIFTVYKLLRHMPALLTLRPVTEIERETHRRMEAEEKLRTFQAALDHKEQEKQNEERRVEGRFGAVTEHNGAMILLLSAERKVTYANAALSSLTGTITTDIISHMPAESAKVFNAAIDEAIAIPGQAVNLTIKLNRHSGGHIWVAGTISNMLNNASLQGLSCTFLDITDIREGEAGLRSRNAALERQIADRDLQLEAANRELEVFSYSVSHDMRAPLRIISGYVDMLYSDHKDTFDEEGLRLMEIVQTNTRSMAQMIDALLNLSRLSQKELLVLPADMASMIKSTIADQVTASGSNAKWTINNIIAADCDSVLMRHVWKNLVANAIKFSARSAEPMITIGSEMRDNSVVYYINDNGVGFDMKYAHKLFGMFQRLHKKTDMDGAGVGLATVQRIVLKHGGYVWAESEVDKGATFYFSLPIKNTE